MPPLIRSLLTVLLATVASVAAAQVPQAVLYEDADLTGRKLTVRTDEPNLEDSDFAQRARSVLVRAGAWQVCTGADYNGDCTVLQPGEYRTLDSRFSRSIVSLRPAGGRSQAAPPVYAPPPAIAVPVYPSSCTAGRMGVCGGCQVTCPPGKEAKCEQGREWPNGGCMFQASCSCK